MSHYLKKNLFLSIAIADLIIWKMSMPVLLKGKSV